MLPYPIGLLQGRMRRPLDWHGPGAKVSWARSSEVLRLQQGPAFSSEFGYGTSTCSHLLSESTPRGAGPPTSRRGSNCIPTDEEGSEREGGNGGGEGFLICIFFSQESLPWLLLFLPEGPNSAFRPGLTRLLF